MDNVLVPPTMDPSEIFDVIIIGGGINGVGIARDAAGRGLKVALMEKGDLAGVTSSKATKLIHGGLRYLEHYEFRLVREALKEREVLYRAAPHIIWPLRFLLPHEKGLRPAWLLRLGLFLYDHLAGRSLLPGSEAVDLHAHPAGAPLKPDLKKGFFYSDCWVDDARLVTLNAVDARNRGAVILPRVKCIQASVESGLWKVKGEGEGASGGQAVLTAKCLINATGPWVSEFLNGIARQPSRRRVRLVKGSHIVTRKLYDGTHAYIFQNIDRRIVFVIPYEGGYSLIGTTDVPFQGNAAAVEISQEEITYLCDAVNRHFAEQITPSDLVWSYAGVRPLYDDDTAKTVSAVTRDYVLDLSQSAGPPLLSVFGGKLTTYRKLAEHAIAKIAPFFPKIGPAWTDKATLPGGDIAEANFPAFLEEASGRWPFLPDSLRYRYARAYGTRMAYLLEGVHSLADLGIEYGGGLYEREVTYLIAEEWARTPEDILWRRSKLGLHLSPDAQDKLRAWFSAEQGKSKAKNLHSVS